MNAPPWDNRKTIEIMADAVLDLPLLETSTVLRRVAYMTAEEADGPGVELFADTLERLDETLGQLIVCSGLAETQLGASRRGAPFLKFVALMRCQPLPSATADVQKVWVDAMAFNDQVCRDIFKAIREAKERLEQKSGEA